VERERLQYVQSVGRVSFLWRGTASPCVRRSSCPDSVRTRVAAMPRALRFFATQRARPIY